MPRATDDTIIIYNVFDQSPRLMIVDVNKLNFCGRFHKRKCYNHVTIRFTNRRLL